MPDTFDPAPAGPRPVPCPGVRLQVRDAQEGDAARLSEFMTTTFLAASGHCAPAAHVRAHMARWFAPDRLAAEIHAPGRVTLIARADGGWAGYARLRLHAPPPLPVAARAPAELAGFYLDARFQGRGAAVQLLDDAVQRAASAGVGALWLVVWKELPRAVRFYGKHGFEEIAALEVAIGATLAPHWLMLRQLD